MQLKQQSEKKSGIELGLHLLNINDNLKLRLSGYSMFPFLREGDIGSIKKCEIAKLKIGDVIVFKHNTKMIGHRLIKKEILNEKYILTTKGDTSIKPDHSFSDDLYVGKLVCINRKGKQVNLQTMLNYWYGYLIAQTSFFNTPFFILNKKVHRRLQHYF